MAYAHLLLLALATQAPSASDQKELTALKEKAVRLSRSIRDLCAKTDFTSSDDAIKLLKQYVDDLAEVKDRLKQLQAEYDQAHKPASAPPVGLPANAKEFVARTKVGALMEFQYLNSSQHGASTNNAFAMRRLRLVENTLIDGHTAAGFTEDLANSTNSEGAWLRDAIFVHEFAGGISPEQLSDPLSQYPSNWMRANPKATGHLSMIEAGQFPLPLGADLERSQFDLEFLERSLYNTIYFFGQRGRGVEYRQGFAPGLFAEVGLFNALTTDDPEQINLAAGTGDQLAETAGLRTVGKEYSLGVNGFAGERPPYTTGSGKTAVTSPDTARRFLYVDGALHHIAGTKLFARGELVYGHDREPNATASASLYGTPLNAFQLHLGYDFDSKNQFNLRWQQLNPNTDARGQTVNVAGFSYRYAMTKDADLSLVYQVYADPSRLTTFEQQRYQTTILRLSLKF